MIFLFQNGLRDLTCILRNVTRVCRIADSNIIQIYICMCVGRIILLITPFPIWVLTGVYTEAASCWKAGCIQTCGSSLHLYITRGSSTLQFPWEFVRCCHKKHKFWGWHIEVNYAYCSSFVSFHFVSFALHESLIGLHYDPFLVVALALQRMQDKLIWGFKRASR